MRRTTLANKSRQHLQVEALESRYAPACNVTLGSPTIISCVDNANDNIELVRRSVLLETEVFINSQFRGTSRAGVINVNGGPGGNSLRVQGPGQTNYVLTDSQFRMEFDAPSALTVNYQNTRTLVLDLPLNNASTVDVQSTPAGSSATVRTGGANDTITVRGNRGTLTVQAGAGNDTVNLGLPTVAPTLSGALAIDGGAGTNTLNYNDQNNATPTLTYTLSAGRIQRNGLADVAYTAFANLNVNLGTPGSHTVNVQSTAAGMTTAVNGGPGSDAVNVGDAANRLQLAGPLTINGGAGANTLVIRDSGATTSGTFAIQANVIGKAGLAPITHSGQTNVTLLGGIARDFVNVFSVAAGVRHILNAGGGNDTFLVGDGSLLAIQGQVNVVGAAGADELVLDNSNQDDPREYAFLPNFTTGIVTATGVAPVVHEGVEDVLLRAGAGNDIVRVDGTLPGVATTLNLGDGDDFVSTGSPNGSLLGPVTVNGQNGSDVLVVDDTRTSTPQTHTVTPTQVSRSGLAPLTYGTVEALELYLGSANQTVAFQGTGAAAYTYVLGGAGFDTFRMGNGSYAAPLYLDGGDGGNALDYSSRSTGVYANLATGEATDLAYLFNLRDVIGGNGNDILVGNGYGNQLFGRGGADLLIAGGWDYPLLPCLLDGGDGQDIVIGGITLYDFDRASLEAILGGWTTGPLDPFARAQRLRDGADGLPVLNETTVYSNYAGNTLRGGTDFDFFFYNPELDLTDHFPGIGEEPEVVIA